MRGDADRPDEFADEGEGPPRFPAAVMIAGIIWIGFGMLGLLGMMSQHPADHVFLPWRQVNLRGRQLGVTQDKLHIGEIAEVVHHLGTGECLVLDAIDHAEINGFL